MKITATVKNTASKHDASVATEGASRSLHIPAKAAGRGSAVNGGELLMLALATCYCNDLYREASRLAIELEAVEVEAEADFEGIGLAAKNVRYRARVKSTSPPERIEQLLQETDTVAEIQNTVRTATQVTRLSW